MIYERIRKLCKARDITISKLERELGFARGHIRKWKTIGPTVEKILLVANYFGVSIDYLVSEEKKGEPIE